MNNSMIDGFYQIDIYWYDAMKYKDKGIMEGEKKGIEKAKREIAKNLLKENVDISLIQKVTNLSNEEIKTIKVNNNTNILKSNKYDKYWYEKILLEKESRKKGRKEGKIEGKERIVRKLFDEEVSVTFMEKVMNMPKEEIIELKFSSF